MKVTNRHHFCKGVTLEVEDGKLKWTVDQTSQRYKYGTIRIEKGDEVVTLDPLKSPDSFVQLLNIAFEFTACLSHGIKIHQENNDKTETASSSEEQQMIDLIYQTPVERKVRLVQFRNECGCGKTECWYNCDNPTIVDLEVAPVAKIYDDLFRRFGPEIETDGIKHYEYPDSVWLFLVPISDVHKAMISIKDSGEYEEDVLYVQFYYDR